MSQPPLISIITPTFNRAKLLAKAMESVQAQDYPFWEMRIWDDGSSDETPDMVANCGDPRIHYGRGTNRGQAFARNQAFQQAKGEYIAFLDDDDRWLPGKLARQVRILEQFREVDVLFANFENMDVVHGNTRRSFDANRDILGLMKTEPLEPGVNLIRDGFPQSFLQRNFILPSSTMMRQSVCAAVGPFNETLRGSEDKEFWWRCAVRGACFAYVEETFVVRRKGPDSFSLGGEHAENENIKALLCCLEDAEQVGRTDLKLAVERAIATAWEDRIKVFGGEGQRRKALKAFQRRCRYGMSLRAAVLAVCSLCTPWVLRSFGKQANQCVNRLASSEPSIEPNPVFETHHEAERF